MGKRRKEKAQDSYPDALPRHSPESGVNCTPPEAFGIGVITSPPNPSKGEQGFTNKWDSAVRITKKGDSSVWLCTTP